MRRTHYCTCYPYCAGGKQVSRATFYNHRQYRLDNSNSGPAVENSLPERQQSLPNLVDPESEPDQVANSQSIHGDMSMNSTQHEPNLSEKDSNVNFMNLAMGAAPDGIDITDPGSLRNESEQELQGPDDAIAPRDRILDGTAVDDSVNALPDTSLPQLTDDSELIFDLNFTPALEDLQLSLKFIRGIRSASLDNGDLQEETLCRIRDPFCKPLQLDKSELYSLQQFLACESAPQQTYTNVTQIHNNFFPDFPMLSLDQVKRRIKNWSGVVPIIKDMCINSCMAYTGPFEDLPSCPICSHSRWDSVRYEASRGLVKVPLQHFYSFPLGPQIQALFREPEIAKEMSYRRTLTETILEDLRKNGGYQTCFEDVFHGSEYLNFIKNGKISDNDILLMFSMDGAQLYEHKQSDCWIGIFVLLDLRPEIRYKKKYVIPAFIIPGPNNPQNTDSFCFPTFSHLSALQQEGLQIWDASRDTSYLSRLFMFLFSADGPGSVHLTGLVGHQGACPCRLFCGLKGRHKPNIACYYPALLKPDNYTVRGCDHGDVDVKSITCTSSKDYETKLTYLLRSPNLTEYRARRKVTGIVRPSLLNGLHPSYRLSISSMFTGDSLHVTTLNLGDLLLPLWRGTFTCDGADSTRDWDWAVLKGAVWKQHGEAVGNARPYIPGSFDRPPRNIAEKINSGYKAKEWQHYFYGLAPALLYTILPLPYWRNFCKLVFAIRILLQRSISVEQLKIAQEKIDEFHNEFEHIYVQRRVDRIHFMRPCLHLLLHLGLEIPRVGPSGIYSTWVMERTVGNLGEEIRLHSNPYANLAERALLRGQVNALKSMIPDLEKDADIIPQGGIALGDGYILLRAHEQIPLECRGFVAQLIFDFLKTKEASISAMPPPPNLKYQFTRWARLRLPTGQTARSAWKESQKPLDRLRTSRNVKINFDDQIAFGEVEFYFQIAVPASATTDVLTLALISLYSAPDEDLYEKSIQTVYSVKKLSEEDGLKIVDVKQIQSVVSMQPHIVNGESRFFLWEQIGLEIFKLGGIEEQILPE